MLRFCSILYEILVLHGVMSSGDHLPSGDPYATPFYKKTFYGTSHGSPQEVPYRFRFLSKILARSENLH